MQQTTTFNHWQAIWTLAYKEIKRSLRVWSQSLLPSVITALLYFLIFGKVMGSRIGTVHGTHYTTFIAPGLVMLTIINNAYSAASFSFFASKFMHHIEEVLVSPMSLNDLFLGHLISAILRGLVCGLLVLLVAILIAHTHIAHPFLMLILSILTAAILSIAGLINGIYASSFDSVSFVPTFVLTPLTFLGGVFYSLQMLPGHWRQVAALNPIYYLIDGFRGTVISSEHMNFVRDAAFCSIFMIILYCAALACAHYSNRLRN